MTTTSGSFSAREWGAIFAIVLIWGFSNIAAQMATHAMPPLLTGGLRFGLALVVLAPLIRPPFPRWKDLLMVVALGGPVQFGLLYIAFSKVDVVGPLVVSLQLWIPMTAFFGWLFLGDRIGRLGLIGMIIAFVGVAVMTLDHGTSHDFEAILFGLGASVFGGLGTSWVRKISDISAPKLQALVCLGTAPPLILLSAMTEGNLWANVRSASVLTWALVAFGAIGSTLIATILMFWLVQRREASRVTPWFLLTPLVSVVFSVFLLGERLTPQVMLGGAATLAGIGFVAFAERRRAS